MRRHRRIYVSRGNPATPGGRVPKAAAVGVILPVCAESTREETAGVRPALDKGVSSTLRYL